MSANAWNRTASAVPFCILLACCQSYEQSPLVPERALAALRATILTDFTIEYAQPGEAPSQGSHPFTVADGLDEAELIGIALTLNPQLRAKRLLVGESKSQLIAAGLWPNPDLAGFARAGLAGGAATGFGLDLLFALGRPDERPAKRAVATAQVAAARAKLTAEEHALAAEVKRARVKVLASWHFEERLQQEAALRAEATNATRRHRALGEATEITVVLAELDQAAVARQVRAASADRDGAEQALNALLGLPAATKLPIAGIGQALAFVVHPDPDDAELERRLLRGRFDLRAQEAAYTQAEAELRLAIAKQYPKLAIGPSFERDTERNSSLGLGVGLELPLLDRNQGEIAHKRAARERVRAEYTAMLHAALAQAFAARAQLRRARAEVEQQQSVVAPLLERADALLEAAFRAGELTLFEWLAARARSLQAKQDLVAALVRYASAVADLEATTGWPLAETSEPDPSRPVPEIRK